MKLQSSNQANRIFIMSDLAKEIEISDDFMAMMGDEVDSSALQEFLVSKFQGSRNAYQTFRDMLYKVSRNLSKDYGGGAWTFFDVESDETAFFAYPNDPSLYDRFHKIVGVSEDINYVVDDKAFGLLASMIAFSNCSHHFSETPIIHGMFSDFYHKLNMELLNMVTQSKQGNEEVGIEPFPIEEQEDIATMYKAIEHVMDELKNK